MELFATYEIDNYTGIYSALSYIYISFVNLIKYYLTFYILNYNYLKHRLYTIVILLLTII